MDRTLLAPPVRPTVLPVRPVVHPDRRVTLRTGPLAARSVTVTGSWGRSFTDATVPMRPDGDGGWQATLGPLAPSLYGWACTVDGEAGDRGTPFLVPGPAASFLTDRDAPAGRLRTLTFRGSAGPVRRATVWTPPGYGSTGRCYPTLYLLPAGDGDHLDWTRHGRAHVIIENLLAARLARPMILVMLDGDLPGSAGRPARDRLGPDLVDRIVPAVESAYRVFRTGRRRGLAGIAANGSRVWHTALTRPGAFACVGTFSAGYPAEVRSGLADIDAAVLTSRAVNEGTRLHRVYLGNADDTAAADNAATRALFDRFGVRYEFARFGSAGHAWETWRHNFADLVPRLKF